MLIWADGKVEHRSVAIGEGPDQSACASVGEVPRCQLLRTYSASTLATYSFHRYAEMVKCVSWGLHIGEWLLAANAV